MSAKMPFTSATYSRGEVRGKPARHLHRAGGARRRRMQRIAREVNFSRPPSSFQERERGGYDVRIFTPGPRSTSRHPTLARPTSSAGTWLPATDRVVLNLKAGRFPFSFPRRERRRAGMDEADPAALRNRAGRRAPGGRAGSRAAAVDERWPWRKYPPACTHHRAPDLAGRAQEGEAEPREYDRLIRETWPR